MGDRQPAPEIAELLDRQDGVIARRQVLACGETSRDCRRRLARREWVSVYPGIYIAHTGPLTWQQRAWCAVLDAHPAALCRSSALPVTGVRAPGEPVHVLVDRHRRVTRRPGVVVHYAASTDAVLWHAFPPRQRTDDAVVDLAGDARTAVAAIAVLADAVQARITTAGRLAAVVRGRPTLRRRRLLLAVLDDIAGGVCSALEHQYLTNVERAHGLPAPRRQAPTRAGRPGLRDVDYDDYRLTIELDGRAFHSDARARDRDMDRDLAAAVAQDRTTLRLCWGQVVDRACSTARAVARILRGRGWTGTFRRCPRCPPGEPLP
ncbi:hypothetical protein [Gordonia sp. VNK21]|uniref:hypothetical protein n=1 Tax=Gordonia sp. VNK21 TaxID=3382483 RepID=UPI0038D441B9